MDQLEQIVKWYLVSRVVFRLVWVVLLVAGFAFLGNVEVNITLGA